MRWVPAVVAGFAADAGWRGGDLVTAVAVALATSDGDDAYRDVQWPGPSVDRRGLFGIDVTVSFPDYVDRLYDPRENAQRAYVLWRHHGGTFDWSPVYVAGSYVRRLTEAQGAAAAPSRSQPVTAPAGGVVTNPARATALRIIDGLRSRLTERTTNGDT